jgi:hypothetical protein
MADYLTTDTDLTAVADAIREKGGTSAALVWPQGYVDAIGAIESGGGSAGPILNPLNGAEMYVENGSLTHTYEFDPAFGTPSWAYFALNLTSMPLWDRSSFNTDSVSYDESTKVLTVSNSSTINMRGTCIAIFEKGVADPSTHMYAFDWFRIGTYYNPCYLRGTLITLADGTKKPVEEVTYDDELLVWDFDDGKPSSAKPLWIKCAQRKVGYHHLTLESGKTLDVVGTNGKAHRLLDVDAEEFVWSTDMVGHRTMTIDGEDRLASCEWREELCEYYNIVTKHHINLYANDILTSCRYNNIYPIRGMRFIKEPREVIPFEAYDVPREWYDGMRLGEQTIPIEDTNEYVRWRVNHSA